MNINVRALDQLWSNWKVLGYGITDRAASPLMTLSPCPRSNSSAYNFARSSVLTDTLPWPLGTSTKLTYTFPCFRQIKARCLPSQGERTAGSYHSAQQTQHCSLSPPSPLKYMTMQKQRKRQKFDGNTPSSNQEMILLCN